MKQWPNYSVYVEFEEEDTIKITKYKVTPSNYHIDNGNSIVNLLYRRRIKKVNRPQSSKSIIKEQNFLQLCSNY